MTNPIPDEDPIQEMAQARTDVNALDEQGLTRGIAEFRTDFEHMRAELAKMMVGYEDQVQKVLIALVAGGNVLLEGVPGLGKTLLVRTLSEILHLDFRRVQFTPDLMPADIIGTNVVDEDASGARTLRFQPGPPGWTSL